MLIVDIYVNSMQIGTETATRIQGGTHPDDMNTYVLGSNKKKIKHRYGDGAAALAEKMMRNLRKQGLPYGIPSHK